MTRILVVEDSPTQAEQLRLILAERGYDAAIAGDAQAARALLARQKFDIVISDIVMPGLSGYEFCHALKADRGLRDLPVVLLSSLNDPMDIIRGLECGADNFITKPYAPDQLIGRVETILENRKLRASGRLQVGVEISFLGRNFTITSDKEQILDLLIATFEDIVRTNKSLEESKAELAAAKSEIERHAATLERRVEERTRDLKQRQEELTRAQSIAKLGSWRTRLDTGAGEWSPEMYAIFGVEPGGFALTRENFGAALHPDDRADFEAARARLVASGAPQRVEFRILRPNGEVRHCWSEGHCEYGPDGKLAALFGFCQDVTEMKLMQQQLYQSQKMEEVGQLTGGVAHDFNNLLTVIIGNVELVIDQLEAGSASRALAEAALKASLRGADLTRQLLAFSRRQPLQPKPISLNEVVGEFTSLLRRTLGGAIEIELHLAPDLWIADADPAQVESALANLAINSRDAMPDGGRLIVETANVGLDEQYASERAEVAPGDYIMLAVTDTGTGIAPEIMDRVFEPFFTTKEVGKGTGLGLSMVYGFAKQSGGHVQIYSEPGHGTTVRLYLPRSQSQAAAPDKRAATADDLRGHETIMVVDDDDDVRGTIVRQLAGLGYRIVEASDGASALRMIKNGAPVDLLFTDVVMPGAMSGLDLVHKARKEKPGLKALLASGFTELSLQGRLGRDAGVELVSKPCRQRELARKLRDILAA